MPGGQPVPTEKQVTRAVDLTFKKAGALTVAIVNQGRGRKGVSDRIRCYRGRFIATEIKRPGRHKHPLSPTQRLFLEDVERAGGIGVVIESAQDAARIIDAIDNGWPIVVAEDRSFAAQPPLEGTP